MNDKPPGNALLETTASELLRHAGSLVRKTAEELESVSKDLIRCRGSSSRILFMTNPEGPYAELITQLICGQGMSVELRERIFRLLPRCTHHEDGDNCSLHPHND